MKRIVLGMLLAGAVLALPQCEVFFGRKVEYEAGATLTGDSDSLRISYQAESGELTDVETAPPWSKTFYIGTNDYPFLAFIRVINDGTENVDVSILLEEESVASGVAAAGGGYIDCYAVITE